MQNKIAETIRSWAGVDTWHTSHPLDEKRFHDAIWKLYRVVGGNVDPDDFRDALVSIVGDRREDDVEDATRRAMTILYFLTDVRP